MPSRASVLPLYPPAARNVSVPQSPSRVTRGSNWVHQALEEREVPGCGFGAFALGDIPAGTTIVIYGGVVLNISDFESLSTEMQSYPYQIEDEIFLGPANDSDIGIGERLNHSCDPNAGFRGPIHIVVLRDVKAGEQVTIDYASCVSSDLEAFRMECACGSSACRGVVTGEDWMLPEVQARLLPHFQPYLQRKVAELRGTSVPNLSAANSDRTPLFWRLSGAAASLRRGVQWSLGFVRQALKEDWIAALVSCIAALPSNLATCWIMEFMGPALLSLGLAHSEAQGIAVVAAVTPFVGYATYLLAYYAGMLLKERRDFFRRGCLSRRALRRKLRVVWYDFLAHLPSDALVIPVMGATQGGLSVAGLPQFWAIFWAQFLADCAYAWKEPFFWHAAKRLVCWREGMRLTSRA